MKKMIHVIEGTTLNMELEGGERVVTFAADIVDDYAEMDAKQLHELMVNCSPVGNPPKITIDQVQQMMNEGNDTFVVEHIGNQAMMHFIKSEHAEPQGTLNKQMLH